MHLAHQRIVNLFARQRDSFEPEREDLCGRFRREAGGVTKRHQGKSHLALDIDIEQSVNGIIHKTADNFGRQPQRRADRQQVGEQRAVVPAEVAIGAVLIFPGVPPVCSSADDGQRGMGDGGLGGGSGDQDAAIVPGAQFAQAKFGGGKVIDAGFEIREIAADQVEFDLVKRAGASSGAKVDFAARVFPVPGNACGKVEQLSDGF